MNSIKIFMDFETELFYVYETVSWIYRSESCRCPIVQFF